MPKTKLATFLYKAKRLSQASLELSSSRGLFVSPENERKRRENREKQTLTEGCGRYLHKMKSCQKIAQGYKLMGAYIGHPKYENTRKPNVLSYTRDKEVIHQNGVVWH